MPSELDLNVTGPGKPISDLDKDSLEAHLEEGIALCLSGGGYRAMLFHLGALIRLNEAAILPKLKRISSVSGGSIVAGLLGLRWKNLEFSANVAMNFQEVIVNPICNMASKTLDVWVILKGLVLPGSISSKLCRAYARYLFGEATLQDLPSDDEGPRFVINASNIQSGALWRFSRPYMRDYRVGRIMEPKIPLAVAVAASSAFPPLLSPLILELKKGEVTPDAGNDLHKEPYVNKVFLTDGGVYDNLGLETAWKRYRTVLVSDGGGRLSPEPRPRRNWVSHSYRVLSLIDNQVRSLRKRQLIDCFKNPSDEHEGTYWGIGSHIKDYQLPDALPFPEEKSVKVAATPTRLKRLPKNLQADIINWGYAVCDVAIRKHFDPSLSRPTRGIEF